MRRLVPPLIASALLLQLLACASSTTAPAIGWTDWTPAGFDRARAERRPVLVYVEAVWCHWCHVMDERTYGDPRVAALLRDRFVPIRVDSDARPDIAERYEAWGWPATAILSPDGDPVLERRGFQEPDAFLALLQGVVDDLDAGREIARRPEPPPPPLTGDAADLAALRDRVEAQLDRFYDEDAGGWGSRQRYPLAAPVEHALLRATLRGDRAWLDRAETTLRSGYARLIDPVHGGLFQYSERGIWTSPHFEKLLRNQAAGVLTFAELALVTGARDAPVAAEIATYVHAHLTAPEGGFYASQDAGPGADEDDPLWRADSEAYFARFHREVRAAETPPRVDRAVYADRNGLMIEALCRLYAATGDAIHLDAAQRAGERLLDTHADDAGLFRHAADDASARRYLDDQAGMGRGLLGLHQVTGDARWLDAAVRLASAMLAALADPASGGLFAATADPAAAGPLRRRRLPVRGNAWAARFLGRLHHVTGDAEWRTAATRAALAVGDPDVIRREGRSVGDYLMAIEALLAQPTRVTVVGAAGATDTDELFAAALGIYEPLRVLERVDPGDGYPDIGRAALYVCGPSTCSPLLDDALTARDEGRAFLARLRRR